MALNKQAIPINFSQGLDLKTDPFQVSPGKFLQLENTVFNKGGLLQKRNGYGKLADLPNASSTFVTTFNNNLMALGTTIEAYSSGSNTWVDKGTLLPTNLLTLPLIRSNTNQSQMDAVVAANGLMCTVYTDNTPSATYKYVIADSITGQNVIAPTVITPVAGTVVGSPRVFLLGRYFIIVFSNLVSGVNHLAYIAISTVDPSNSLSSVSLSAQYTPHSTLAFDGVVANNTLYLAWNGSDLGGSVKLTRLSSTLVQSNVVSFPGRVATIMSVTADQSGNTPVIYASFYNSGDSTGYTLSVNHILVTMHAPVQTITAETVANITSAAQNGLCTIISEITNAYGYDGAIPTNYLKSNTITQSGTVGTSRVMTRSTGLASKASIVNSTVYCLSIYSSINQPSYFLLNLSGQVVAKLAYSNGGGYYTTGLPTLFTTGNLLQVPYLIKDQIQAVNKTQGLANASGVYSQVGINLASIELSSTFSSTAEIGTNLNIPGGVTYGYDGYVATENGFFLWPDYVEATPSASGGSMSAQQYFYIATYEWTDNQGNAFRSAPSIPVGALTTTGVSSVAIDVPTLRLTYKLANPVKIVLYRWSTAQQTYYQVTSIASPVFNDVTVDYVTITDTSADSSILGNNILYTTGGVLENISPPASDAVALFQSRLFLIDSEDKNLLWFSKQVIENTPVEMSDLLTIYVAPTTSAQGNTGVMTALSALDDKLIIFKKDAIYYIAGTGPDNTGANSQYSDPVFITSTVGCSNQKSIVFMPQGLMFQSDKGIWLLGRDLNTTYIGAPVEAYTQAANVLSAVNVPGTNQVRFTMDSGITLMYDYYYGQWGTFVNVPAVSSTLYQSLHTYVNSFGQVLQETPGSYLDGSSPVLMNFTSSWFNLGGLQGFERAYSFYLLGSYISPHKLAISIAHDYNSSPTQVVTINPDNFSPSWGGLAQWGSSPNWGGGGSLEQWRVFFQRQKCQSFQISLQEIYDPTKGASAGAGLTLSGMNLLVGIKSGYPRIKASNSIG